MASNEPPDGADFAFDMGLRVLDEQERRTNALDSKAGVLLAGAGVFAGLVFRSESLVSAAPYGVTVLLAVLIVMTVCLAVAAFANRRYQAAPAPRSVTRMMSRREGWLRWRFLGSVLDAIEVNERKLQWKARTVTYSQFTLLASVLTLGGYFMYSVVER